MIERKTIFGALPTEYSKERVELAMREGFASVDRRIDEVVRRRVSPGGVEFIGGVQGGAPGGGASPPLPLTAVTGSRLRALPAPDEVTTLSVRKDLQRDSWATATIGGIGYTGPRRFWRVNAVAGNQARGVASARYRIVADGMVLTPLSCRFLDQFSGFRLNLPVAQTGSRWEVLYGMVLFGVPNRLGRMPVRASVDWGPNSPGSQEGGNLIGSEAWLTNNKAYFEAKALSHFGPTAGGKTSARATYDSAGIASGWMLPATQTSAYMRSVEGFDVMVITADNIDQVYAQLNSRPSINLSFIGGRSRGLAPPDREVESPFPANVAAIEDATQLTVRTEDTLVDTDEVVEGCPVRYDDCQALLPTSKTLAMVVMMRPARILTWGQVSTIFASPTDDLRPALWQTAGIKIASGTNRSTSFDIILE